MQLVGTLYFNVSCGVVMVAGLSAQAAHQHVWERTEEASAQIAAPSGGTGPGQPLVTGG